MKKILMLMLLLVGVGVWFGINFAKDRPLLSNPFEDADIRDRAVEAAGEAAKEGLRYGQEEIERRIPER